MATFRLLLIEDDADHRVLLHDALTHGRANVDIQCVSCGAEALDVVGDPTRLPFDCILLDYNLPDYDAAQLLPALSERGSRCPVLVCSASHAQEVVIKSQRQGSFDFIPKVEAMHSDRIWNRIDAAVESWRSADRSRRRMQRRAERLTRLAEQDPLTGLANRRQLDRFFHNCRQTFDRRGWAALVVLDIDHFKRVNDEYGHVSGDRVLCAVAELLRQTVGAGDVVCRYGGEEFVIILPGRGHAEAVGWAEHVRRRIAGLDVALGEATIQVTASLGVLACRSKHLRRAAIGRADAAMYLAKVRGRNRTCTWEAVTCDRAAQAVAECDLPLPRRWSALVEQIHPRLGATQHAHLTAHARDVADMAVRLGSALRLEVSERELLWLAGLCHDLGKCMVPEWILAKPGPLSASELALVSRHAAEGAELAVALGACNATSDFIRYHHTRYDGTNAAAGMRGDRIPLGARILNVADAFVAMTSERPYQRRRNLTAAVQELQHHRGTQFDPMVVDTVASSVLAQMHA